MIISGVSSVIFTIILRQIASNVNENEKGEEYGSNQTIEKKMKKDPRRQKNILYFKFWWIVFMHRNSLIFDRRMLQNFVIPLKKTVIAYSSKSFWLNIDDCEMNDSLIFSANLLLMGIIVVKLSERNNRSYLE